MQLIKHTYEPAVMAIDLGMTGKEADELTKLYASVLVEEDPLIGIPLPEISYLKKMVEQADLAGLYFSDGNVFITALFKHELRFPIARSYSIKYPVESAWANIAEQIRYKGEPLQMLTDNVVGMFIEVDGYKDRLTKFQERIKKNTDNLKALFEGRAENTITDSAVFLGDDDCLLCGGKTNQLMTTTLVGDVGTLFGFNLCDKHVVECEKESSNLDYLISSFGGVPGFKKDVLSREEAIILVSEMLVNELSCEIDKVDGDTITAYRIDSNFRFVLRLTSETDYAYMVFEPESKLVPKRMRKKDVSRIDSADHHSVEYGPSHLHKNLKNKKEKPVSSFTTGFPLMDKKALLKMMEEKELEYKGGKCG